MNNKPLVTIGIPTFNRKELLKRALDSAINQTYKNIEIIVADNHSDDGTEDLMADYCAKDSRIRYLRHEKNMGIDYQTPFCLEKAKGVYSMLICDDDYVSENYVEECVKILTNNPQIIVTYGTVNLINEDNNIIKKGKTFVAENESYTERFKEYIKIGSQNYIAAGFMDTNLYREIAEDFNKNRFCEDQLVIVKTMLMGKFRCSGDATYYKLNNGSTKNLKTLKEYFKLPNMTHENYWYYLAREYMNSVLFDSFYKGKLSENERIDLALELYKIIGDNFKIKAEVKHKSFGQKVINKIRGKK